MCFRNVRNFRKRTECFRFPEIGHEYFCLFWFVCFVLIVDRHHIDYRTLGSQAAANLLGEVSNKSIESTSCNAGGISKRSFISTVGPTVTLIRHENGAFRKRSSDLRNLTSFNQTQILNHQLF